MCAYKKIIYLVVAIIFFVNCSIVIPVNAEENDKKISIVVDKLTANEVSEAMAETLRDALRNSIFQTYVFDMIPEEDFLAVRKKAAEALAEKQKLGMECDTEQCWLEEVQNKASEKKISLDRIVRGSVGKIDQGYLISLRLIDMKTFKMKGSISIGPYEEKKILEKLKEGGVKLTTITLPPDPTGWDRIRQWIVYPVLIVGGIAAGVNGSTESTNTINFIEKGNEAYDDYLATADKTKAQEAKNDADDYNDNARAAALRSNTMIIVSATAIISAFALWYFTPEKQGKKIPR